MTTEEVNKVTIELKEYVYVVTYKDDYGDPGVESTHKSQVGAEKRIAKCLEEEGDICDWHKRRVLQ